MIKHRSYVYILLGIALIVVIPARYFYRENKVTDYFISSTLNTSKYDVINKLGVPDQTEQCGQWLWWGGDEAFLGENKGECTEWVRYNFVLHTYGFGFTKDGKLISKYKYYSE